MVGRSGLMRIDGGSGRGEWLCCDDAASVTQGEGEGREGPKSTVK